MTTDDDASIKRRADEAWRGGDHALAQRLYREVLLRDPHNREAHQGLARLLEAVGDRVAALSHRQRANARAAAQTPGRDDSIISLPRLLLLTERSPSPLRTLLREYAVVCEEIVLAVGVDERPGTFPPHDLVVNAISNEARESLGIAQRVLARLRSAVINDPVHVAATQRAILPWRLATIPQLQVATTDAQRLSMSLAVHDAREMQGEDEVFRSYRLVAIDRSLYPVHLAHGRRWQMQYAASDTPVTAQHRAEEEAFLRHGSRLFSASVRARLESLVETLALDMVTLDFEIDVEERILLFGVLSLPEVHAVPDAVDLAYRRDAYHAVGEALHRLIERRLPTASFAFGAVGE